MNNLIINHITNIFESGNYELAIQLAKGQNVDLADLNVDFNKIINPIGLYSPYFANIQIAKGFEMSIAAGIMCKSMASFSSWASFEIAVITKHTLPLWLIEAIGFHIMEKQVNDNENMYIYAYMTNANIIHIIKHIINYAESI